MKSQSLLQRKSAWSLIGVSLFGILLIYLIWNNQLKHIERDRQESIAAVVNRNNNRVASLEQYTIRTIKNADAVLQMVIKDYARSTDGSRVNLPPVTAYDLFSALLIADKTGKLTAFNSVRNETPVRQVADKEYFRFHVRHPADSLFIGKPFLCPLLGHEVIPISRRISTPDGHFAGVVAVFIEPTTFTRFYAHSSLLPHDIVSLIAPDGTTYARRTGQQESFGENISKSPLFTHVALRPVGSYFAPDAIRGVATFFSYRRLQHYPIIATVGAAEDDVMAAFHERALREYNSSLIICVLIALFSGLVCFFMLVNRRHSKIIQESEARYRSFFENSLDAILISRPSGEILAANPAACTIFDRTEEDICRVGREGLTDASDPRLTELLLERAHTGKARGEFTLVRRDGSTFPGEVSSALFTDSAGQQFATMIIRDITRQKQLQKKILKAQKRFQRKLTEQVICAQEREREVIGRELHDNVNQVLTTVKLYLELAQSDQSVCDTLLPRCVGHVMDSINEIRKLSRDLSAPTLGTRSLVDSVEALVEMIRTSAGLRITLRHNKELASLPMDMKLAVYRILQEQLNNIVRHARATKVLITLYETPDHLSVTIKDNGQGFDTTRQREGIGINNMISRARVFDGRITLKSAPGQGCMVHIFIPLAVKEANQPNAIPAVDHTAMPTT